MGVYAPILILIIWRIIMKIEVNSNLCQVIKNELIVEFSNLYDKYKDLLGGITIDKISIDFVPSIIYMYNEYFTQYDEKANVPAKYIRGVFTKELVTHGFMNSTFDTVMKGNHIAVSKLALMVNIDELMIDVISDISSLESTIECFKIYLRHEFGHFIDFVSHNGMTKEEHLTIDYTHIKQLNQYTEKCAEAMDNNENVNDTFMETFFKSYYHDIDAERRANENVGLSWKDFYEMNKRLTSRSKISRTVSIEFDDITTF